MALSGFACSYAVTQPGFVFDYAVARREEVDRAAIVDLAEEGEQERRFAGAVGANDGGDAAGLDVGGDAVEDVQAAQHDADVFEADAPGLGGGRVIRLGWGGHGSRFTLVLCHTEIVVFNLC